MADYTPPSGDDVDFSFSGGYSAPEGDNVNLLFGIVADIDIPPGSPSRLSTFYSDTGFERTIVRWTSSAAGQYRIEMGGTGAETGDLIATGTCAADTDMLNTITFADISGAAGYTGEGEYRFNIYVKSSDDIWTPYG